MHAYSFLMDYSDKIFFKFKPEGKSFIGKAKKITWSEKQIKAKFSF